MRYRQRPQLGAMPKMVMAAGDPHQHPAIGLYRPYDIATFQVCINTHDIEKVTSLSLGSLETQAYPTRHGRDYRYQPLQTLRAYAGGG